MQTTTPSKPRPSERPEEPTTTREPSPRRATPRVRTGLRAGPWVDSA